MAELTYECEHCGCELDSDPKGSELCDDCGDMDDRDFWVGDPLYDDFSDEE